MNCCFSDNRIITSHRRLENVFLVNGCSWDSWSGIFWSLLRSSEALSVISLSSTSIFRSWNPVTLICFQSNLNFRSAHWADRTKLILRNRQWSETLKLQCNLIACLSNCSRYELSTLTKDLPCDWIFMLRLTITAMAWIMGNRINFIIFLIWSGDYRVVL